MEDDEDVWQLQETHRAAVENREDHPGNSASQVSTLSPRTAAHNGAAKNDERQQPPPSLHQYRHVMVDRSACEKRLCVGTGVVVDPGNIKCGLGDGLSSGGRGCERGWRQNLQCCAVSLLQNKEP